MSQQSQLVTQTKLQTFQLRVQKLKPNVTVRGRPIFSKLHSGLSKLTLSEDVMEVLEGVLEEAINPGIMKLNANDTPLDKIEWIFGLRWEPGLWKMANYDQPPIPERLTLNLRDLKFVGYGGNSEARCRLSVDTMLIQALVYLRRKQELEEGTGSTSTAHDGKSPIIPSTPPLGPECRVERCHMFPEPAMSVKLLAPNGKEVFFGGKADWAFGYRRDDLHLLTAIEAKQEAEFSHGWAQLIAYLFMMRCKRIQAGKINVDIQGFYSDRVSYQFVTLSAAGVLQRSKTYDIEGPKDLKTVFYFIVAILDTAMKKSPKTSPTKCAQTQHKQVYDYEEELWKLNFVSTVEVDGSNLVELET